MIDRLRDLTQVFEPAGRICELILQAPTIEPSEGDQIVIAADAAARDEILSVFSESGQVERALSLKAEDGTEIVVGARVTAVGTAVDDQIMIMDDTDAIWEVTKQTGGRLPFYTTAKLDEVASRRAAKSGATVRGRQASDIAVCIGDEYLPISIDGNRALCLTGANRHNLLRFLATPAANEAFPLKFSFSRKLAPTKFKGHIEFKNVEFRYPTEQRVPALRDVSFNVEAGKMAALVGHAGCGKSTIFKLIKRLYDPTVGTILLDGKPLKAYDVQHLRRKIAVVAQENVLF